MYERGLRHLFLTWDMPREAVMDTRSQWSQLRTDLFYLYSSTAIWSKCFPAHIRVLNFSGPGRVSPEHDGGCGGKSISGVNANKSAVAHPTSVVS